MMAHETDRESKLFNIWFSLERRLGWNHNLVPATQYSGRSIPDTVSRISVDILETLV
jgi:hypothetical protein